MLNYTEHQLEIKDFSFEKRTFRASATGIGNVDFGLDMFVPGAFTRTIQTRVAAGKVKFVDAHFYKYGSIPNGSVPSTKFILGKVLSAVETDTDLIVEIYISDTPDGNDLLVKIKDGVLEALSVGYIPIKVRYDKDPDGQIIRILEEVKLMEISAVIWGMNDRATIDATSVKTVSGMQSWPLAEDATPWNATAAIGRLQESVGGKDSLNFKEYRRFFFYFDGANVEKVGSYKLPYCDVIDGKVMAIPKALSAVASRLDSTDMPGPEKEKVRTQLAKWYAKMKKDLPAAKPQPGQVKAVTFEATLSEELAENDIWKLNQIFNETIHDVMSDEAVEDKTPLLEKALDDYKAALAKLLGLETAEKASESLTSGQDMFIIHANEPLIALLTDAKAYRQAPVPPEPEGTRFIDEDKMSFLRTKLSKLKIEQLKK